MNKILIVLGILFIVGCQPKVDTCMEFFRDNGLHKEQIIENGVLVLGSDFDKGEDGRLTATVVKNKILINNAHCTGYLVNNNTKEVSIKNLEVFDNGVYYIDEKFTKSGIYNYSVICNIDGQYFGTGYDYVCVR